MWQWLRANRDVLIEILIILVVGMGVCIGAAWFLLWWHEGIE